MTAPAEAWRCSLWALALGGGLGLLFGFLRPLARKMPWVAGMNYEFTAENALDILLQETGKVFAAVLEDAGVYKNTEEGKAAFQAFVDYVNQ